MTHTNDLASPAVAPVDDNKHDADQLNYRQALIEAVAPVACVKGLEWEQNSQNTENSLWANVDSIGRSYTIEPESFVFRVETQLLLSEYGPERLGLHPTLEAAKAVAQADLVRRISPLLASSIIPATKGGEDELHDLIESLEAGCRRTGEGDNGEELFDVEGATDIMWQAAVAIRALAQDTDGVAR